VAVYPLVVGAARDVTDIEIELMMRSMGKLLFLDFIDSR
jgi:hypothetical protein